MTAYQWRHHWTEKFNVLLGNNFVREAEGCRWELKARNSAVQLFAYYDAITLNCVENVKKKQLIEKTLEETMQAVIKATEEVKRLQAEHDAAVEVKHYKSACVAIVTS